MKMNFLVLVILIGSNLQLTFAQSGNYFGRITYDMFVDLDKTPETEASMNTSNTMFASMIFNMNDALFIYGQNTETTKSKTEQKTGEGKIIEWEENYGSEFGNQYLKQTQEQELLSFELIMTKNGIANYRIKEALPELDWKIDWNSHKKINQFNCQKATASFRGRTYTAWFTISIPVPHGPWKLGGLPGLMLEVYSDHHEIWFLMRSVSFPIDPLPNAFEVPDAPVIDWEEYVQKWQNWSKKLMGYQVSRQIKTGGNANTVLNHMENVFDKK